MEWNNIIIAIIFLLCVLLLLGFKLGFYKYIIDLLLGNDRRYKKPSANETCDGISVGDTVRCNNVSCELVVINIKDKRYECYNVEEAKSYGFFSKEEITLV